MEGIAYMDQYAIITGNNVDCELKYLVKNVASITLLTCEIPTTIYNVNVNNYIIKLKEGATTVTGTLAPGNYTVGDIISQLAALLTSISPGSLTYTITYSTVSMGFTISAGGAFSLIFPATGGLNYILGFAAGSTNASSGNTVTSTTTANLANPINLFIRFNNVSLGTSPFLAKIQVQSGANTILYNAENTSYDNTKTLQSNQAFKVVNFSLVDDYNNLVSLNGQNWYCTIRFFYHV